MQDHIDLVVVAEEKRQPAGLSIAVVVSAILHAALLIWFVTSYHPVQHSPKNAPIVRYVELMKQNPRDFVEAPGPAVDKARLNAPLSDKNRKASMPEPTGTTPTARPGDGSGFYTPPAAARGSRAQQSPQAAQAPSPQVAGAQPSSQTASRANAAASNDTFVYHENTAGSPATKASAAIDWRSAIRQVRGPVGAGDGIDLGQPGGGGEKGFAEQGPISFETQWFDWGDYAQSMVSRIRVNWYGNMPQLIRTGMAGVVTIRFTIQRDGSITDVTILKSSGAPPYDFAARKAIELSSPLNPLPKNFPNPSERVTAMFYYNTPIQ